MDLSIRNLDDAAGAKLTQLAKKKGISRESYVRTYLETLAVIGDMKELDIKYNNLVKEMAGVINNNSQELHNVYTMLETINEKLN